MQFKVPQDVQQADRIVWFLTLPQLIISVVGFAIAYAIYTVLEKQGLPIIIWLPPVAIVSLLTAAFAFLKIANLPFHKYLALIIERFVTPSKRVWVKGADRVLTDEIYVSEKDKKKKDNKQKDADSHASKQEKLQNIGKLTDELDKLKNEKPAEEEPLEEIDKTADEELLQKAFLEKERIEKKETIKKEESVEDKIMELSKKPDETAAVTPEQQKTENEEEVPQKKKRRRRRKRKRNKSTAPQDETQRVSLDSKNNSPQEPKETVEIKKEIKKEETQKPSAPLPDWLNTTETSDSHTTQDPTAQESQTVNKEMPKAPVKNESITIPEEKAQEPKLETVQQVTEKMPVEMNTAPEQNQANASEAQTKREEAQTKTTTDQVTEIAKEVESTPVKKNEETPIQDTSNENNKTSATSGEFTPDQLTGEGQVITFDSPKEPNNQNNVPNN